MLIKIDSETVVNTSGIVYSKVVRVDGDYFAEILLGGNYSVLSRAVGSLKEAESILTYIVNMSKQEQNA